MKKIYLVLFIALPYMSYPQFAEQYSVMTKKSTTNFTDYETLLLNATDYILNNPVSQKDNEFVGASQIVEYWMDKDTWFAIPIGYRFHQTLSKDKNQKFLNIVSIINYILHQKETNQRLLTNMKVEGQIYKNQADVREVQLEGAKIFLTYAEKPENEIKLNSDTKIYLEALKQENLKEMLLQE